MIDSHMDFKLSSLGFCSGLGLGSGSGLDLGLGLGLGLGSD